MIHRHTLICIAPSTSQTSGLGHDVRAELHDDAADGGAVSSDVEEDFGVGHDEVLQARVCDEGA